MGYMKMLGLLAIAVAALMALAGSASAAKLTSPTGTQLGAGTVIKATAEKVVYIDGSVDVSCKNGHIEASVTNAGGNHGVTTTVEANLTKLEFTDCADTVTVVTLGTLSFHSLGNNNHTVTSSGLDITVQLHRTVFGFPITTHCGYATNNTDIGTLTGSSHSSGGRATLHLSGRLPQTTTDGACGSTADLTGSYEVTAPDPLYVD